MGVILVKSSNPMIYLDGLWIFVGSAPVRLSTVITFLAVFLFATWRFRGKGWVAAFYNGVIAALFMLFLYEVLFNITGGFPPTDLLPLWGVGLLVCSILLGILQARRHFRLQRFSIILFSAFMVDWFVWILVGFPFNLPSTQPLNLVAEVFNVTTKLLLPFGYATGLTHGERVSSHRTAYLRFPNNDIGPLGPTANNSSKSIR